MVSGRMWVEIEATEEPDDLIVVGTDEPRRGRRVQRPSPTDDRPLGDE
jgi:hypothetical protein